MENQVIEVKTDAALSDAQEIKQIVKDLQNKTQELNDIMNSIVNSQLSLDWADDTLAAWNARSMEEIEQSFASMNAGAASIEDAIVQYSEQFSNGKK